MVRNLEACMYIVSFERVDSWVSRIVSQKYDILFINEIHINASSVSDFKLARGTQHTISAVGTISNSNSCLWTNSS